MKTLKEALQFVLIAQGKGDREFHKHCRIENGTISATDGIVSAGCRIEEDLQCKPNTELLLAALSKCKNEINFTQVSDSTLSIKSGRFKASIPCFELDLPETVPDGPCITEINRDLLKSVSKLVSIADKSQNENYKSVFIKGGSVFATDGRLLVEIWQGGAFDQRSIPIDSCKRLLKIKGDLSSIASSDDSNTFYFTDDSWFKTPLASSEFPHIDEILNIETFPTPLTKEVIEGFRSVAPFCEMFIKFENNLISSIGPNTSGESQYEIDTPSNNCCFSVVLFSSIMGDIKTIDFNTNENLIYFFGDNMRGALAKGRE